MKIQILSLSGDTIRFLLHGATIALANALRRVMIAELPCMHIEDIFIFENSSLLPDEILAHRVGLVPLVTDLDSYVLPNECQCESELGCSLCRVVLTLDVESGDDTRVVYSGDLTSEDSVVVPMSPDIPFVKLAPDQAVRFEAYAQLGIGKDHAKWQPVSQSTYQHVAVIDIDPEHCTVCGKCIEECPKGVLDIVEGKLSVIDLYACRLCSDCVEVCPVEPSAIKQEMEEDVFLFTVESTGCLPPERIVSESANVLIRKLDEFSGKIQRGEMDEELEEVAKDDVGQRIYSAATADFDEEEEEQ